MYKRTIYLVDTENATEWADLDWELGTMDKIVLFHTEKSPHVKISSMMKILALKNKIEDCHCLCGSPNALDFQLCVWLGANASKAPKTTYVVLSNDHGYDVVCKQMQQKGYLVRRQSTRGEQQKKETETSTEADEAKSQEAKSQSQSEPIKKVKKAVEPEKYKAQREIVAQSIKAAYRTKENVDIAFSAVASGDKSEIRNAVLRIMPNRNKKEQERIINHWIRLAPSIMDQIKD